MDVVLDVQDLRCGYGDVDVLEELSFTVAASEVLCVLGRNGAGKTTLFKSVLGFLPARGGRVLVDGRALSGWGRRELARTVAYVPQAHAAPFPFTVGEVVLMGRTPHLGVAGAPGRADRAVAEESMDRLGVGHLATRPFTEISGGERQLALIARALTQQPRLLMMDEPTSNLDLGNQARVLHEIRDLAAGGLAIVMISHTPDHAFAVASTAALLRPDRTLRVGTPEQVLTEGALGEAFGRPVRVLTGVGEDGATVRACLPVP
ncbi:iron complex transport system ATP-binding protein [Pseudonocardia sediminis]|uniref:Iron complex transport system ATP-binding protein n=1 Tax=Pseudonocardia sediminis TaxID=1397368 RepID=A0A4Q7V3P8_PSEST|nr:ABC transporter ATP-binding protein [Pseudonocardia sediminis]RZT87219.1 iron complex transport system ATP-binding protein [Pseudonocardia sediminis]